MKSNNYAWIVAAVLGVFAVAGWFLHLSTDEDPITETTQTAQPTVDAPETDQLRRNNEDLQTELESLIAENTALQALSDDLKAQVESAQQAMAETSGDSTRVTESESEQVISEKSAQVTALSEQIKQMELEIDELLKLIESSGQSSGDDPATEAQYQELVSKVVDLAKDEEHLADLVPELNRLRTERIAATERIQQLESERRKLLDKVTELSQSVHMMDETVKSAPADDSQASITPQSGDSDSASDKTLEEIIHDAVDLSNKVLNALATEPEQSQQASQTLEYSTEALLDSLTQSSGLVKNLTNKNENLINENELLSAQNQTLKTELQMANATMVSASGAHGNPAARTQYLLERLHNARKQLKSARMNNRQLVDKVEYLNNYLTAMNNAIKQQLSEKGQLATTLFEMTESKDEEIKDILSHYTRIGLESDVIFRSGSAKLNLQGQQTLRQIAEAYTANPNYVLSVEGHTDDRTISSALARLYPTNWELSAARAASAARFLTSQGVPESQIRVVGYGYLQPIASNDTEEGRRRNRRIEISLSPQLPQVQTN